MLENPHRVHDKICYLLINHLPQDRPPVLIGIFSTAQAAIDAFAQNFELKRVEGRHQIRFFKAEAISPWRVYEASMNVVYSLGVPQRAYSIGLEADAGHQVGRVVCEPSQKEKDQVKLAAEAAAQR